MIQSSDGGIVIRPIHRCASCIQVRCHNRAHFRCWDSSGSSITLKLEAVGMVSFADSLRLPSFPTCYLSSFQSTANLYKPSQARQRRLGIFYNTGNREMVGTLRSAGDSRRRIVPRPIALTWLHLASMRACRMFTSQLINSHWHLLPTSMCRVLTAEANQGKTQTGRGNPE